MAKVAHLAAVVGIVSLGRALCGMCGVVTCGSYACAPAYAQVPSQHDQLRIGVWAELDAFPGLFGDEEPAQSPSEPVLGGEPGGVADAGVQVLSKASLFSYSIGRTKQIAPYLLGGMIHGWAFDYTPSDKLRGVSEYFELLPVRDLDPAVNPIEFHSPQVIGERLCSWAYCDRTAGQTLDYERWTSIENPKIHGTGQGLVSAGMDGIRAAVTQAARNAIHEYWRRRIKNKPKEITGKLLLIGEPRIYISEGRYTADLDFFMQTDKIAEYTTF